MFVVVNNIQAKCLSLSIFSVIFNHSFSFLWCIFNIFQLSVKFNRFRSCSTSERLSLSIFGHVQTSKVCRFRSNSTTCFSHLHSVKLTSLKKRNIWIFKHESTAHLEEQFASEMTRIYSQTTTQPNPKSKQRTLHNRLYHT